MLCIFDMQSKFLKSHEARCTPDTCRFCNASCSLAETEIAEFYPPWLWWSALDEDILI